MIGVRTPATSRRTTSAVALGFAVVATLLVLSRPATAQEITIDLTPPERIAGHVIQSTVGAAFPDGVEVRLMVVDAAENLLEEQTQAVAADGAFEFDEYPRDDGTRYRLQVQYGNLLRTVNVEDSLTPDDIGLRIYETTNSLDSLSVGTHAIIVPRVDGRSRLMGVLELVELVNDGDRTFVPDLTTSGTGMPDLVRFALPPGYQELSIESDLPTGSVIEIDRGFALSNAVPPGEFSLLFSYAVEYGGDSITFDRTLPLGARELRLLVPPSLGDVSGDGLAIADETQLGETQYRVLRGDGYEVGASLEIRFTGLPQPSFVESVADFVGRSALTTIGIPALAALAMAALLAYVFLFRSRQQSAAAALQGAERQAVVDEIAALDERYEGGEFEDEEYDRLRALLVDRILGRPATEPEEDSAVYEDESDADDEEEDEDPEEETEDEQEDESVER